MKFFGKDIDRDLLFLEQRSKYYLASNSNQAMNIFFNPLNVYKILQRNLRVENLNISFYLCL